LYSPETPPAPNNFEWYDVNGEKGFPTCVILDDQCTARILTMGFSTQQRRWLWPANFNSQGQVRIAYKNRGHPAKDEDGKILQSGSIILCGDCNEHPITAATRYAQLNIVGLRRHPVQRRQTKRGLAKDDENEGYGNDNNYFDYEGNDRSPVDSTKKRRKISSEDVAHSGNKEDIKVCKDSANELQVVAAAARTVYEVGERIGEDGLNDTADLEETMKKLKDKTKRLERKMKKLTRSMKEVVDLVDLMNNATKRL
jgi:chaperonin cofactor prefoldin